METYRDKIKHIYNKTDQRRKSCLKGYTICRRKKIRHFVQVQQILCCKGPGAGGATTSSAVQSNNKREKHPPNRRVAAALRLYRRLRYSHTVQSIADRLAVHTRIFELSYNILTAEYKDTAISYKCVWVIVVCHCYTIIHRSSLQCNFPSLLFFFSRGCYYVSNSIGQCIRFPDTLDQTC